jgi:hypothetical protein
MTDPDESRFGCATDRMTCSMLLLAAAGSGMGWILWGWRWGLGFLAGAAASFLNFRWLRRMVEALGESAQPRRRPKVRAAVFLGLRYGLLGLGAYVILVTSALSVPAVLSGLFVAVAAVIAEILFQLVYARN